MYVTLRRAAVCGGMIAAAFGSALAVAVAEPASFAPAQAAPVAPAAAATESLPPRLTNQEFWAFVNEVSEPGGFFRSDNLLSNETGFQSVIPRLLETTRRGGVYLGVGPEQNFTYIAALQPRLAVIFDIRRGNLHMHLLYKALFEMSGTRAEFVSRLFSKPQPAGLDTAVTADSLFGAFWYVPTDSALYRRNREAVRAHLTTQRGIPLAEDDWQGIVYVYDAFYYGGPVITYSYPSVGRGNMPSYAELMTAHDGAGLRRSYLASEGAFRYVKTMHERNLIIPVVGDFAGPTAIRAVGAYLRRHNATVTAFYVSNVEQYLFQSPVNWRNFYENVGTLPLDSASTFIRSIGGGAGVPRPPGSPMFGGRLPSVTASMQQTVAAWRDGRITSYSQVIQMSR